MVFPFRAGELRHDVGILVCLFSVCNSQLTLPFRSQNPIGFEESRFFAEFRAGILRSLLIKLPP